jgi:hypothetical protein
MDCLMTLSRTVDLNSPPVLQLDYYIFAISTVISLPPFTHNLTVKENELIKFSNNTYEFFATINKVIGMNYYPSLSSLTTMPNTPPLKFPPSTQTTDATHDFGRVTELDQAPSNPSAEDLVETLKVIHESLRQQLTMAQTKYKQSYDAHIKEAPLFKVGDLVWLSRCNIIQPAPRKNWITNASVPSESRRS